MARILYGVSGEGNGHAIRTEIIVDELLKKHTVTLFSHGKGYKYLKKRFPVRRILGFHMYYINNTVSSVLTGSINLVKFPFMALASLRYIPVFLTQKPACVITDFEPFLAYWAKVFGIPCISIDNQHSITNTAIHHLPAQWLPEAYSRFVVYTFIPNPRYCMVTSFFDRPVLKKNTFVFAPLIRKKVSLQKKQNKGHVFVYQTSPSYERLLSVLKQVKKKFIVYGYDKEKIDGNLHFKRFNDAEHLEDLATADAVIINGGFTVLSEALYLEKPIFAIPIKRQFEQIINGHYLNRLGYGIAVKDITVQNFELFLKNKEKYRKNIKKIQWDKNRKFFEKLEGVIQKL